MNPSSWIGAGGASNLQVLWEDGERVFCRGESHANGHRAAVLAVLPAAEHPTPATLDRLAREYELKDELDGAWWCSRTPAASRCTDCSGCPWRSGAFCASPSRSLRPSRKSTGAASSTRTSSRPTSWWTARPERSSSPALVSRR